MFWDILQKDAPQLVVGLDTLIVSDSYIPH